MPRSTWRYSSFLAVIIAHHADKPLSLPWLGEQKDEFEALKLETGRRPPNAAPRGTSEHTENKPKERLRPSWENRSKSDRTPLLQLTLTGTQSVGNLKIKEILLLSCSLCVFIHWVWFLGGSGWFWVIFGCYFIFKFPTDWVDPWANIVWILSLSEQLCCWKTKQNKKTEENREEQTTAEGQRRSGNREE